MKINRSSVIGFVLGASVAILPYALMAEIRGKANQGTVLSEAGKVTAASVKGQYESHEFLLPMSSTDFDVKVQQSAFQAAKVPRAHTVTIRTDQDITIKFNTTGDDPITLTAVERVMTFNVLEITNIFLTNTTAANVKITLG